MLEVLAKKGLVGKGIMAFVFYNTSNSSNKDSYYLTIRQKPSSKPLITAALSIIFSLSIPILIPSCGGNYPEDPLPSSSSDGSNYLASELPSSSPPATTDASIPRNTPLSVEELILSEAYGGSITIIPTSRFNDMTRIRAELASQGYTVRDAVGDVKRYKRLFKKATRYSRNKHKLVDMSNWLTVEAEADDALYLYNYLSSLGLRVSPSRKSYPTGIESVPDLTPYQGYLNDFRVYTFDGIADGSGVTVFDAELLGGFYHHSDISNVRQYWASCGGGICLLIWPHANAVMGIVGGDRNGFGIDGFADGVQLINGSTVGDSLLSLFDGDDEDGAAPDLSPGDIYLIESQVPGVYTLDCGLTPYEQWSCQPEEVIPEQFNAIKLAIEYGITVVAGAGNGSINLDNPAFYYPTDIKLYENDSGSILVGASQKGKNSRVKAPYSNCGSRVTSHGWGYDVVTTAYPVPGYNWDYTNKPWYGPATWDNSDPLITFTNNFGGTSAAAAMVAGSAALLQSYAKQELGSPLRYIRPLKMRQILTQGGTPQQIGGYTPPLKCEAQWEVGGPIVNKGSGMCPTGLSCTGVNPVKGGTCNTAQDCLVYGGYETINPDCVYVPSTGKKQCGSSWCATPCSSNWSCPYPGWSPVIQGNDGKCVCHPPLQPIEGESCNIGVQPRLDVAKASIDNLITYVFTKYPKLANNQPLTEAELIDLQDDGVGLVCNKEVIIDTKGHTYQIVGEADPSCPPLTLPTEEDLWPKGVGIAKKLDFDGDGRADLVQWSAEGIFKLDLSSIGDGLDKFGSWDVALTYPSLSGKWIWPYVADIDSDGRTDLVLYEKDTGTFYIKYTRFAVLNGTFGSWDLVVNTGVGAACKDKLELDPWQSTYGRVLIGDYNYDKYNDLSIACSNGMLYIDYGGGGFSNYGQVDFEIRYLNDARLTEAPGWSYQPFIRTNYGQSFFGYRIPMGLTDEARIIGVRIPDLSDWTQGKMPPSLGDDVIIMPGFYLLKERESIGIVNDSSWFTYSAIPTDFTYIPPTSGYGNDDCAPIASDFDGDDLDDRAVMCPDGWRIAYSGTAYTSLLSSDGFRYIPIGYEPNTFALPGRPYYGGIGLTQVWHLINLYKQIYPNDPPPIPVDMVRTSF